MFKPEDYIDSINDLLDDEQTLVAENIVKSPLDMQERYMSLVPDELLDFIVKQWRPGMTSDQADQIFRKYSTFKEGGKVPQSVQPGPGRPGYAGEETAFRDLTNKAIDGYESLINKLLDKGDLSDAPSFTKYLQNKYKDEYRKVSNVVEYDTKLGKLWDGKQFLNNKKLDLTKKLITQYNLDLKYNPSAKTSIINKTSKGATVGTTKVAGVAKEIQDLLSTLDTAEDKVGKALDIIVEQNLPIKASGKPSGGLVRQMVSEISGVGGEASRGNAFLNGLKKSKYWDDEFAKSFNYLNRVGQRDLDIINYNFDDAMNIASERLKGGVIFGDKGEFLKFSTDPNKNIMNYVTKHWDRNNFNKLESRIELYDRSKMKTVDGKLVPKGKLTLEDIKLKWEPGKKYSFKDIAFSYDGSEVFDNTLLRLKGKESGLFNEVYETTQSYYDLRNRQVPDPKNPKNVIKFGDLMDRDFGKNSLAIGHNAPGGIKAEPFTNLQLQTQKMNNALYHATKNITDTKLREKVIKEIYGDLYNLKGEAYIEALIKNPPSTNYVTALDTVTNKKLSFMGMPDPTLANQTEFLSKFPKAKAVVGGFLKGEAAFAPVLGTFEAAMGAPTSRMINSLTYGLAGDSERDFLKKTEPGSEVFYDFYQKQSAFEDAKLNYEKALKRYKEGSTEKGSQITYDEIMSLQRRKNQLEDEFNKEVLKISELPEAEIEKGINLYESGTKKVKDIYDKNRQSFFQNIMATAEGGFGFPTKKRQEEENFKFDLSLKPTENVYGTTIPIPGKIQTEFASGGLASLTRTIPPKRGPNYQGLASLPKYGKQY